VGTQTFKPGSCDESASRTLLGNVLHAILYMHDMSRIRKGRQTVLGNGKEQLPISWKEL
jgi:hypothetical protein